MIKISSSEIAFEPVTKANSVNTQVKWLITDQVGAPHFAMRRYKIDRNGKVGLHSHEEEHEVFVLTGEAEFSNGQESIQVTPGDAVFIPPHEQHTIVNTGPSAFEFICLVPGPKKR